MNKLFASCALLLSMTVSGCSYIPNKAEEEYKEQKVELEREVELLVLQKRKAMLEKQLDAIHNMELRFVPVDSAH